MDNIRNVIAFWIQGEITNFIILWLSAYLSLIYIYFSTNFFHKGPSRLAAFLPVISLFLFLPFTLHSVHLSGVTAFFLSWLANFKLLMLAFDKGPLPLSHSLSKFIALTCLPIRLKKGETRSKSIFNIAIKAVIFSFIVKCYDYEDHIHPWIIMLLYAIHVYLCLEIILAVTATLARTLLGVALEPQFDEPYLASSLQDFWGRRWNLMVTRILRPTVYLPVLEWCSGIVGRKWASLPAVMATFVVSGLIHELIFYYLGRVRPTWEITCFFLIHGACLVVEVVVKKEVKGRWRLPRVVGTILTVGFVMVTGFWLFFPPLLRCKGDERALAEMAAVGAFVKDVVRAFNLTAATS